jgi:glycosyltransferase involved in cell wall biosynthesis
MPRRVLIITYYWPPSGGAGVQRWLKFAKYLSDYGWELVIYTPENPEIPVRDASLLNDVNPKIKVLTTKVWEPYQYYKKLLRIDKNEGINSSFVSERKKPKRLESLAVWIRGNFFIPDARRFWIKPSIKYLSHYLRENPVDVIVSTGPPHSMHLIAQKLQQKLGIPWLADFRDPWTNIDFYHQLKLTRAADRRHHRLEKLVLTTADQVVVISEGMKKDFARMVDRSYQVITNGYDSDDLPTEIPKPDHKFSIAHMGTLAKSRNPDKLWEVLSELVQKYETFAGALEIKLIGKVDYYVKESLQRHGLESFVVIEPYLNHNQVALQQQRTQILLLLINNTPNARMILTGKLFEYMAAGRPILCIGPTDGDAAKILQETGCGDTFDFDDHTHLKKHVLTLFDRYIKNENHCLSGDISKYSRRELTARLDKILQEMVNGRK